MDITDDDTVDGNLSPIDYVLQKAEDKNPELTDQENLVNGAALLSSVGFFDKALEYYSQAYLLLEPLKHEFTWEGLFCRTGISYATLLDHLNRVDEAEKIYNEVLEIGPNGTILGDYAIFLHKRRRQYDIAERYYTQSIAELPHQSSIMLKYAGFMRHIRKNLPKAEKYYKRSIETNPNNADAIGTYASFLHGGGGSGSGNNNNDLEIIEKLYQRSIELDVNHPNNLCNYGLFLSEEKHDYNKAEMMYKSSLNITPEHTNTLYNYGVMLDSHLDRKDEAESMYRRALKISPKQPFALYNLAVLLEEKLNKNYESEKEYQIQELNSIYHRAVDANSGDAVTLADYGRFLITYTQDFNKGEKLLSQALEIDSSCAVALYHLGIINHDQHKNIKNAEKYFRILRKNHPRHIGGMQYLTVILRNPSRRGKSTDPLDVNTVDELMDLFEQIIMLMQQSKVDTNNTLLEYTSVTADTGNSRQKLRAITFMEKNSVSSDGNNTLIDMDKMAQKLKA